MATPTLVQYSGNPNCISAGNITEYHIKFNQKSLSGNAIFVCAQYGADSVTGVADNKSNSYSQIVKRVGNQTLYIYAALNTTAGVTEITISSAAKNFVSACAAEFYNIATSSATDGTATGGATSTDLKNTVAAWTTAVDGDLLLVYGCQTQQATTTMTSWGAGTGFALLGADIGNGFYALGYQVQGTHGTIAQNTTLLTQNPSQAYDLVAAAFKNATSGTAPSSTVPNIIRKHQVDILGDFVSNSTALPFPCKDGTRLAVLLNATGYTLSTSWASALTDSNGNTWLQAQHKNGGSGTGTGDCEGWYCDSPTCSENMTLKITFSGGTVVGSDIIMLEMQNLGVYDTSNNTTGNNTSGSTFDGATITPTTTNGLCLGYIGANTGSASEIDTIDTNGTDSGQINFISPRTIPVIDTNPVGENQGASSLNNQTSGSPITRRYTTNGVVVGQWADIVMSFKGLPAAGPSPTLWAQTLT